MIYLIFAAVMLVPVYLLWVMVNALQYRIEKLEKQKPELTAKTGQLPVALPERQEQPKAGTVAAKAIQPVVFLSQVSHKAVQLDNGGLEWEGKV